MFMEDLNKYMEKPINSLNTIRSMTQEIINRKEEYLKETPLNILSTIDLEDNKKMTNTYKSVVDRNNLAMDFIIDIKNEIFKIKLIKESIDRNTAVGIQQIKQQKNTNANRNEKDK